MVTEYFLNCANKELHGVQNVKINAIAAAKNISLIV